MNARTCSRRAFLKMMCAGVAAAALPRALWAAGAARPNILLVIADDWGWGHAGVFGDPVVKTPNFDRIAREGVLFRRAYCAAPTCTASRAGLLTGQMPYRLGESVNLYGPLERQYAVYPDLLEAAGYAVGMADKGLGPGDFRAGGRTRNPAGPVAQNFSEFLTALPADKPFCYWFGSNNPHRPYNQHWLKGTVDEKALPVPPFLPDAPEVRGDLADYYAEVQAYDAELGRLLESLEKSGRLDETLIVVTSDNGMPFPRAKCNLYDSGTRMPTAIRWGNHIKPGRVVDEFVSLCDLAPTFLAAAGVPIPPEMTGQSLLGVLEGTAKGRDFAVVCRERHGASVYPCRAIHTRDYLYIRNFRPESSPKAADPGPAQKYLDDHATDPAVAKLWAAYAGPRPAEELYDNRRDPHQMTNVIDDPAYAPIRKELAHKLQTYLAQTGDPRALGRGEIIDNYPDRSKRPAATEQK